MNYAGIVYNDFSAAPGVCLSFFTQGCPAPHCKGCHNPETWNFDGGREFTDKTLSSIIKGLQANGIKRSFCVMGGEPLCPENSFLTYMVIKAVKDELPETKIYVWTKYLYEDLKKSSNNHIKNILELVDVLIDGPYIEEERDITLPMRGSRNQHIWDLKIGKRITEFEQQVIQECHAIGLSDKEIEIWMKEI